MVTTSAEQQSQPGSGWHSQLEDHSEDEDHDCCRICRGSAQPLFYPCKCSGSIKYVHQQCLMDWLSHSGNTHCELCKHEFVFTPVYAKDAPARLPWTELAAGLVKRAMAGAQVAHRIWVVACVWLIAVPWFTCFAWRLAFLRSFDEVPQLLRERWNVLAIATDCIQGSLLSIGVVFVNMSMFSLKQHVKNVVRRLENQLLRDAVQQQPAAVPAAPTADVEAGPARDVNSRADMDARQVGESEVTAGLTSHLQDLSQPAARSVSVPTGEDAAQQGSTVPLHSAIVGSSSSSSAAAAVAVSSLLDGRSDAGVHISSANAEAISSWSGHQSRGNNPTSSNTQQQQQQQPQQPQQPQPPQGSPESAFPAAAVPLAAEFNAQAPASEDAMLAAAAAVGAVADPGGVAEAPDDAADVWGDVPIEELLGLQGPWVNFLEMVVLLLAGNASFMAGCVYLPLNIGRLMLMAMQSWSTTLVAQDQQQQQHVLQLVAQQVRLPVVNNTLTFLSNFLNARMPAVRDSISLATAAVVTTATATTAAPPLSHQGPVSLTEGTMPVRALDVVEPMSVLPLNFDVLLKELRAQMQLTARVDFVALSLGHALLGIMLLVGLWVYVSMRLWRAARRRLRASGRRPLMHVIRSTGRWLLSTATMICKGLKLTFLLSLELGAFPVLMGLWLDFCALPLTSSNAGQRKDVLASSPVISGLMHWVVGVGFVLALTFLLCVLREVLRPGALAFIRDPTNPDRNPLKEMLEEPLVRHLGRVTISWLMHAGLCVVLVHFPVLIAKALVPSLYPLRLALFDPLTQIPADMLLLHIFIPFTVEHVRVKGAVKAAVRVWLGLVARVLDWSDYLLPGGVQQAAVAPVPLQQQQQQRPPPVTQDEAAATSAEDRLHVQQQQPSLGHRVEGGDAQPLQELNDTEPPMQAIESATMPSVQQAGQQVQQSTVHVTANSLSGQHRHQFSIHPLPVQWYEQQDSYAWKALGLVAALLATLMAVNTLLLTVPIALGRVLFMLLHLPFKNDLFTGILGLIMLSGVYMLAAAAASNARLMNMRAVAAAAWRWGVLMAQCGVLLVLWLGVVATMLGMLCELVLLPLRLPPNQTALIYLYQDWTMGVLALKLWHLLVTVNPQRDGRAPVDPDSWQAHLEALQAGGLRNLDLHRALTKLVLPVLLNLATCLSVPYVISRGLLPHLGLSASALQYANLYAHQACHGCYVVFLVVKRFVRLAVQLHNTIRDDKYLLGRELQNSS